MKITRLYQRYMDQDKKLVERRLESKEVFRGSLLHVFKDRVQLPDESTSAREYIKHPGASAVLPVFENGDVMLVRQYRYPLSKAFLEVPAGKIDPEEDPDKTALRELREETGLECNRLELIGQFHPSVGYTDEVIYLYVAWDIRTEQQEMEEDEFLVRVRLPFHSAVEKVHSGEITDGKTMVTLLRSWEWWQENEPFVF